MLYEYKICCTIGFTHVFVFVFFLLYFLWLCFRFSQSTTKWFITKRCLCWWRSNWSTSALFFTNSFRFVCVCFSIQSKCVLIGWAFRKVTYYQLKPAENSTIQQSIEKKRSKFQFSKQIFAKAQITKQTNNKTHFPPVQITF